MLPGKNRDRNGGRRGTSPPVGRRKISPREPIVLPKDEYETGGEESYDWDWENEQPAAVPVEDDDPVDADAVRTGPDAVGGDDANDHSDPDRADEPAAEPRPLTAGEIRFRRKRDERIWKRTSRADRHRLCQVADPAGLAGESSYTVACYGAALRVCREVALDAYDSLDHEDNLGDVYRERKAEFSRRAQNLVRFNEWVAEHRPELADDDLLDRLAGSQEDRAEAKARLAELDKKYRPGSVTQTSRSAPPGPAVPLPLIYQKAFRGKVRAYPGWVAPVLRKVAGERSHQIPAMALVLAQLAYWMEPADETGRPRATRAKLLAGQWWIVLGYGQIEKQTPVSKGQAKRAIRSLKDANLVETLVAKKAGVASATGGVDYGPNTVFLRVNTEVLDPLVRDIMTP